MIATLIALIISLWSAPMQDAPQRPATDTRLAVSFIPCADGSAKGIL